MLSVFAQAPDIDCDCFSATRLVSKAVARGTSSSRRRRDLPLVGGSRSWEGRRPDEAYDGRKRARRDRAPRAHTSLCRACGGVVPRRVSSHSPAPSTRDRSPPPHRLTKKPPPAARLDPVEPRRLVCPPRRADCSAPPGALIGLRGNITTARRRTTADAHDGDRRDATRAASSRGRSVAVPVGAERPRVLLPRCFGGASPWRGAARCEAGGLVLIYSLEVVRSRDDVAHTGCLPYHSPPRTTERSRATRSRHAATGSTPPPPSPRTTSKRKIGRNPLSLSNQNKKNSTDSLSNNNSTEPPRWCAAHVQSHSESDATADTRSRTRRPNNPRSRTRRPNNPREDGTVCCVVVWCGVTPGSPTLDRHPTQTDRRPRHTVAPPAAPWRGRRRGAGGWVASPPPARPPAPSREHR